MGYSHGNCEIVETKNEFSTYQKLLTHNQVREQEREQSPPVIKMGDSRCLEDDINKLFEAVNVRTSKSLDLSDSWRNALKRPMRSPGSYSPGIGLSEPVSLKQALRGLCISQAAEMAAMKRLSMQSASPRISEAGKNSNSCRSLVIEARVSGCFQAVAEESRMETHSVAEESTSYSSGSSTHRTSEKSAAKSSCSLEGIHNFLSALPHHDSLDNVSLPDSNLSGQSKVASGPIKDSVTPLEAVKMGGTKLRSKSKLQNLPSSSGSKSNKGAKSAKNLPRTAKPVFRNKNLIIMKSKKVVASNDGYSKSPYEVYSGLDQGSGHLICQRCQCALRDTNTDSSGNPPAATSITNSNMKLIEKGDISQSSSSICDFSSSTTSLSEDSSLSGNRPHMMSKDMRWGAISRLSKQYGSLGLSHFNLLKKLGSGDIGTVYLAELIGTNCLFAIKIMDNEYLARRGKMLRAQTEGEILRMLDHPFLPTLYAQFTSDNLSCLVMEFCPGGDLHVLRQKQPGRYFPEQEARFYVAEVLLALEYLHMLGIVYRDLKPENILVREDGHIMLTDFDLSLRCSVHPTLKMEQPRISGHCAGSNCIDPFCSGPSCFSPRLFPTTTARVRERRPRPLPELVAEPTEARSNSFVGTHEYLAPEIINGESHGSAVDWWTFGVLLYELLYGKTPFKGAGNGETLSNAVLQPLRFPDSPMISLEARDLIRGLLVKEAENRLGAETGAAEIKRHRFFEGMNWALIRCAIPPQIPEMYDVGNPVEAASSNEKGSAEEEHLVFELF